MAGSQLYIGAPNGVVVCVDSIGELGGDFSGRLFHKYSRDSIPFASVGYMIRYMENLFNELNFPKASTNLRVFPRPDGSAGGTGNEARKTRKAGEEKVQVMSDNDLLSQHGYQGTFIIRVQHRQNSTWQGRITWADKDMTQTFRSVWEMINLMESAMTEETPPEGAGALASWDGNGSEEGK